jgi:hypothetical protein
MCNLLKNDRKIILRSMANKTQRVKQKETSHRIQFAIFINAQVSVIEKWKSIL